MRVLVLGASGMIGSGLLRYLPKSDLSVKGLTREQFNIPFWEQKNSIWDRLDKLNAFNEAEVVINCIGLVKQLDGTFEKDHFFYFNSTFPIQINEICLELGKKFINISTDCVFDGHEGNYSEKSIPNSLDPYGMSKSTSEVIHKTNLVIRTSTLAVENSHSHGLLNWYIHSKEPVRGFCGSVYTGVSMFELSKSIVRLLELNVKEGLFNVASEPITKSDLLSLFYIHGLGPRVIPLNSLKIDRSLNDEKFRVLSGLPRRSWADMTFDIIEEVHRYGI